MASSLTQQASDAGSAGTVHGVVVVRGCLLMASPRHSVFSQLRQLRPKHKHSKSQAEAASLLTAQPWESHVLPSCCTGHTGQPRFSVGGEQQGREHWEADLHGHLGRLTVTGGQRRAVSRQDRGRYSSHTRCAAGWVPGAVGTEGCLPRGHEQGRALPSQGSHGGACLASQVTRSKMEVVPPVIRPLAPAVSTPPQDPHVQSGFPAHTGVLRLGQLWGDGDAPSSLVSLGPRVSSTNISDPTSAASHSCRFGWQQQKSQSGGGHEIEQESHLDLCLRRTLVTSFSHREDGSPIFKAHSWQSQAEAPHQGLKTNSPK